MHALDRTEHLQLCTGMQVQRRQREEVAGSGAGSTRHTLAASRRESPLLGRDGGNGGDGASEQLRSTVSTLELTAHQLAEEAEARARAVEQTALECASNWERRHRVVARTARSPPRCGPDRGTGCGPPKSFPASHSRVG